MNIGQLLTLLNNYPKDRICYLGFAEPHSYRGYYDEAAVEPATNVTIGSMIDCLEKLLDETFTGYKGGEFRYDTETSIHLAYYGSCNDGTNHNGFSFDMILGFGGANQ